jgi:hypothetical protein
VSASSNRIAVRPCLMRRSEAANVSMLDCPGDELGCTTSGADDEGERCLAGNAADGTVV